MAPGHGRGQGFSQQGQLSAHTAGVETTGKQVRGRPLEQLAKDWRCQKQAPKTSPGGRAPAHVPASSGRPGFARIGATPACSGSRAGTAPAARASRKRSQNTHAALRCAHRFHAIPKSLPEHPET